MKTTQTNFNEFAQDAEEFTKKLANAVGHPNEQKRALILWRAVMHTIRDRIHFGESLDLIGPLPMILKGMYVENWRYVDKPPLDYETMEEMEEWVEKRQRHRGEEDFDWNKTTAELIGIVLDSLGEYLPDPQMDHILGQLPKNVKLTLERSVA